MGIQRDSVLVLHQNYSAKIAQLVEHDLALFRVNGFPALARIQRDGVLVLYQNYSAKIAQLVEHDLAKVGVAGSSPVFRSVLPEW
jgi:hypothetical protein